MEIPFDLLYHNILNQFNSGICKFLSTLFNYDDMPRSRVDDIVKGLNDIFQSELIEIFITSLIHKLNSFNAPYDLVVNIQSILTLISNPFINLDSEHRKLNFLQKYGTYIPPQTIEIGQREDITIQNDVKTLVYVPVTIEFIPLRTVLKKFLEKNNTLRLIDNYLKSVNETNELYQNIIQGTLWQTKILPLFKDKYVLPLVLYQDDHGTNNPIGSHRANSKVGAMYVQIPCLPPSLQSKAENIFTFILFNPLDAKLLGYNAILQYAKDELEYLEETGIKVLVENTEITVYFALAAILGDNLAVHGMMGFVQSFIGHFCCRFCKTNRNNFSNIYHENFCLLRTHTSYEKDVEKNNVSLTGINEACYFNKLKSFHVIDNLAVDVMHDLLEGVCQYTMGLLIHEFIEKKYFDRDTLNNHLVAYNYMYHDLQDRPPEITETQIKNKKVIISSAEMLCLVRNFNFIIGHSIPLKDKYWRLFLLLKKIIDITTSKSCVRGTEFFLESIISEFLILFCELFPNHPLSLKFHILLHYRRMYGSMGPPWNLCSMNFENKHQSARKYARVCLSRININHSIAVKSQLKLNYYLSYENDENSFYTVGSIGNSLLKNHKKFHAFRLSLPTCPSNFTVVNYVDWIGNHKISDTSVLVMPSENGPQFHIVEVIIKDNNNQLFIITTQAICEFDNHFEAFEIHTNSNNFTCLPITMFEICKISNIVYINNKSYVPKRWI